MRIYIYNISIPYQEIACKGFYCQNQPLKSQAHTCIFEPVLHHYIETSPLRECDPESADLFYSPIYFAAFNMHPKPANFDTIVLPMIKSQGPYYDRFGGVDHAFVQMLFAHHKVPITLDHERSIPGMMTFGDIEWSRSLSDPRELWRCTVLPYASNFDISQFHSPRPISLFFIGQVDIQAFDRRAKIIRGRLINEMTEIPRAVFLLTRRKSGVRSSEHFNISSFMVRSEFCAVPHGDGPSSKRLYDSMKSRCIPIVLTDEIRFPFEDVFVDYRKFILQVPAFKPKFVRFAFALPEREKERIRQDISQLDEIMNLSLQPTTTMGDQIWAWLWSQYFRLSTVASCKRRSLLQCKYL